MEHITYFWNTYIWLWMVLLVLIALAFTWAIPMRRYRERRGLGEFHASLPEPQRQEVIERLANEYEQGLISRSEYERRLDALER